eukprot:GHVS01083633.1.p1 GENE.GHVS01083633.1~~GHVS01083633.1.p1  ORF type:complete len:333 (+),score=26.15 GHVS01083633.1:153-1151(+)
MPASPKFGISPSEFTSGEDKDFDLYSGKKTFLFPGQGAQYVGMGSEAVKASPNAKELFEKASVILGYDLLDICTKSTKQKLDKTEICQPATFVHSMAAVERLREEKGDSEAMSATVCLGLSLGEYSALCYAGAISFDDCVTITKERGKAMQEAADKTESGMVSVLGLEIAQVEQMLVNVETLCGEKMVIANYLSKGNYVVSGGIRGCKLVEKIAKPEFKARLAIPLAVAGAFHTDFMLPAVNKLNTILDQVKINKPRIPVISNVDGKPHSDPDVIRNLLKKQIVSPVQWESSMRAVLSNGYEQAYELGPGAVLKGIVMRIEQPKGKTVTCIA